MKWMNALFFALFLGNANALDACLHLVGHWDGFYTIKDKAICESFGGCTHKINVNVHYPPTDLMTPVIYEALVNPSMGQGGVFDIRCDNGIVESMSFPMQPAKVSCDSHYFCEMVYEDRLLLSKMTKGN